MEENKKVEQSGFNDILSWLKKHKKLIIIIIILVVVFIYFRMRNNCITSIDYVAEVASGTPFEKPEHYTLSDKSNPFYLKEFKTKNEAVSYCMSSKF